MKGNRLTLAPLCWLLGWMLLVDSFKISVILTLPEENQVIPMSMAEDAVDDMLKQPSPGEGEKEGSNMIKKRAFNIVLIFQVTAFIGYVPLITTDLLNGKIDMET
eukprot:superscaffoldBa00002854_g15467